MSPCHDLVSFADGELDAERAAAFREHLRTCEACQEGLVEAMQLSAHLSTLPPRPVDVPDPPPWWQRLREWLSRHRGPIAGLTATAAALVIVPHLIPTSHDDAFAGSKTRPGPLRWACAGANEYRPPRDVQLGGRGGATADRIPFSVLSAL